MMYSFHQLKGVKNRMMYSLKCTSNLLWAQSYFVQNNSTFLAVNTYEFLSDFQLHGKIKKRINSQLQKGQACGFSSNVYDVAIHSRIHDSVIDLAAHCTVWSLSWTAIARAPCVLK